ncbi:MAG: antibiotic biosynthesis monooxygenase [Saprospiraceae bacterium]|nr:antibiotic biosynthesis monooxygenase [Saprospiraceae bacterium]
MIKRIVKLTFQEDKIDDFIQIFEETKEKIRSFEGCHHLELWQAREPHNVFFTYSYWTDEKSLNQYRYSELFKATWSRTKVLFAERPEAWSVDMLHQLNDVQ